jgi:hypothetical protein
MAEGLNGQEITKRASLGKKLETAGWSLFFIWTGFAFLMHLGWGVGLLGVGMIILGGQMARKYLALKREGFWLAVGFCFIMGGIWELFRVQVDLAPILCMIVGFALLASIFIGRARNSRLADR